MEARPLLATITVNTTADVFVRGFITLRQAINAANGLPPGTIINFNIGNGGPKTIVPLTPLPSITEPVTIDGTTQPGFDPSSPQPIIAIDGSGLKGTRFAGADGLDVLGGNSTIRGLAIDNFGGNGLYLAYYGNDAVQLNYLGIGLDGTTLEGNGEDGLLIDGITGVTVGPPQQTFSQVNPASYRNVISANGANGIHLVGVSSSSSSMYGAPTPYAVIDSNYIGTNRNGTAIFGYSVGNHQAGILLDSATTNVDVRNNTISCNLADGVLVEYQSTANIIANNKIGVAADGRTTVSNDGSGINLNGFADGNIVAGNILSGNKVDGITIQNNSNFNQLEDNQIGTIASGTVAIGNGRNGVTIFNSSDNQVGVLPALSLPGYDGPNVISGNHANGVQVIGLLNMTGSQSYALAAGSGPNLIQSNRIGTDLNGALALPNGVDGVAIDGGSTTTLSEGNVISGNPRANVEVTPSSQSSATGSILISSNRIGTTIAGSASILNRPSTGVGIAVDGVSHVIIGGVAATDANVISGNPDGGLRIEGEGASGDVVMGNLIGTDLTGELAIGNGITEPGLFLNGVGGITVARNVISGNFDGDVEIALTHLVGDTILNNQIGTNATGTRVLAIGNPSTFGILLSGASNNLIQGNTIALGIGGGVGIVIDGGPLLGAATANTVQGNTIGTNSAGAPLGNDVGIYLNNVYGNLIGGTTPVASNIISTSQNVGVDLFGTTTTANTIEGNQIGAPAGTIVRGFDPFNPSVFNVAGTLGNGVGVFIDASSGNTIRNNLIAGNFQAGLFAFNGATNTIQGNLIENNGGYGVLFFNTLGSPDPRSGNTVRNNNGGNFRPFIGPNPSNGNTIMSVSTLVGKATHATASAHRTPATAIVSKSRASHIARNFRASSAHHGR
jgi:parallel beta-helix repeat protein